MSLWEAEAIDGLGDVQYHRTSSTILYAHVKSADITLLGLGNLVYCLCPSATSTFYLQLLCLPDTCIIPVITSILNSCEGTRYHPYVASVISMPVVIFYDAGGRERECVCVTHNQLTYQSSLLLLCHPITLIDHVRSLQAVNGIESMPHIGGPGVFYYRSQPHWYVA